MGIYQIILDLTCAVMAACILIGTVGPYDRKDRLGYTYLYMNICALIMMQAHAGTIWPGLFFRESRFSRFFVPFCLVVYFVSFFLIVIFFCSYVSLAIPESRFTRLMARSSVIVCGICAISWSLFSLFQEPGPLPSGPRQLPGGHFSLAILEASSLLGFLIMGWCLLCILIHVRRLGARTSICLLITLALPTIVSFLQPKLGGISCLPPTMALCSLLHFVVIRMYEVRRMRDKEVEWMQMRLQMTIGRLQPHFLYNSLNTIYYLCDKDPAMAKQAIGDFSRYLRGNLDAISLVQPIPFEREMEAVKTYLHLEKLRFEDEIRTEFDLCCTSFLLPALTLQSLVENAIKHGLYEKEGGGTVKISSWEDERDYHLLVEDDGAGFNPLDEQEEEHTGLRNVRERLRIMCQGVLLVSSTLGKGTRAEVRIPKEKEEEGHEDPRGGR